MLSRVASSIYWLGRYLERAENVARLLLATDDLSTEIRGFNEKLADAEWSDLLTIFAGAEVGRSTGGADEVAIAHLNAFFAVPANAYSIHYSLRKARENARAVREALTLEVFVNLNDAYRQLEAHGKHKITDLATFRDALGATQRDLLGVVGAIEHTLSRDQGYGFLKLGESLERVYRTSIVLSVKLRTLTAPGAGASLAIQDSQWRGLLRALSSLENYRMASGARMEPSAVVQFLMFSSHAPRSLRYGANAVKAYLDEISGSSDVTAPARVIGRLTSLLRYDDERALGDPVPFIDHAFGEIARTHEAIEQLYFGT